MRYALGIKLLVSFLVGGVAILYKMKINPRKNQSEISAAFNVPRRFLFDTLTSPINVPAVLNLKFSKLNLPHVKIKYFSWVSQIKAEDRRNMTIGKRYRGVVNMPFLGQHDIRYKISEVKEGHWVVLKPDDVSYFNTEVILMLNSISAMETQFHLKIIYHRTSALFQYTLAPLLKWLTDQQLNRASISARNLIMTKWNKFQYPKGKNGTKPAKAETSKNKNLKYTTEKLKKT